MSKKKAPDKKTADAAAKTNPVLSDRQKDIVKDFGLSFLAGVFSVAQGDVEQEVKRASSAQETEMEKTEEEAEISAKENEPVSIEDQKEDAVTKFDPDSITKKQAWDPFRTKITTEKEAYTQKSILSGSEAHTIEADHVQKANVYEKNEYEKNTIDENTYSKNTREKRTEVKPAEFLPDRPPEPEKYSAYSEIEAEIQADLVLERDSTGFFDLFAGVSNILHDTSLSVNQRLCFIRLLLEMFEKEQFAFSTVLEKLLCSLGISRTTVYTTVLNKFRKSAGGILYFSEYRNNRNSEIRIKKNILEPGLSMQENYPKIFREREILKKISSFQKKPFEDRNNEIPEIRNEHLKFARLLHELRNDAGKRKQYLPLIALGFSGFPLEDCTQDLAQKVWEITPDQVIMYWIQAQKDKITSPAGFLLTRIKKGSVGNISPEHGKEASALWTAVQNLVKDGPEEMRLSELRLFQNGILLPVPAETFPSRKESERLAVTIEIQKAFVKYAGISEEIIKLDMRSGFEKFKESRLSNPAKKDEHPGG